MPMYTRALSLQKNSFFLFGPRGVGKSFWLKQNYSQGLRIDLLKSDIFLKLQQKPRLLREMIEADAKILWVIIDEVQKRVLQQRTIRREKDF